MKKIIFLLIILIIIIVISIKVNYKAHITLSFGNNISSTYVYKYQDTRLIDIINDIKNNIKIRDRYIQNILVRADMIYLDLKELNINKNNLDELNNLLALIRSYTKERIYIINNNDILTKRWIFKIKDKYDIIILDEKR